MSQSDKVSINPEIQRDGIFRKSSFSATGNCVAVAKMPDGGVHVRDTKAPDVATLQFTDAEWRAFLQGVHNGEFEA